MIRTAILFLAQLFAVAGFLALVSLGVVLIR